MKKILAALIAVATFTACSNKDTDTLSPSKKTGKLEMQLQTESSFIVNTKAETQPSITDFTIVIRNSDGTEWRRWDRYGDGITVNDIPEGNYTLEAFYGTNLAAAWEAPYFFGSQGFSINAGQTTNLAVTAKLANSKLTVSYSDKTLSDITDIEVVVTSKSGGNLTYTPTETRAGYFAVPDDGVVKVIVTGVRKSNNQPVQQTTTITGFEAAQWHRISVSLKSTSGNGSVSLTINTDLIEKEQDIEIPDFDDITGGGTEEPDVNKPTVVGSSYNGNPFEIDEPLAVSATDVTVLDVLISAESGIDKLLVKIISPTIPQEDLAGMGLGGVFDMATPGDAEQALTELGLYDPLAPIKGKKAHTFSVGGFMAMLAAVNGIGQTHTFEIEVVDANGNSVKKSLIVNLTE